MTGRVLVVAVAVVAAGLFLAVVPGNPPGFYRDESSIAYNAYTISQSAKDEYGATLPLFFRSFGDYKSPAYTYALAAVFRVAGPSIEAARLLSAVLGLLAVGLLGLLAARVTGRSSVGALTGLVAALNPWLFEVTRLVFEVALLPLAIVLFLLAVQRGRPVWAGVALGLVVYAYPAGRLLAPLLAVGLLVFWRAWGWRRIAWAWGVFAAALVPILVFSLRHPGALSSRFGVTTYVTPGTSAGGVVHEFVVNYLRDVDPWSWLVHGDPNVRHHVHGMGSLLGATLVLAAIGLVLAAARHRRDPWWQFAAYGLVVSPVPGTLTVDRLHTLRMVAFPIFLLLFAALALATLLEPEPSPGNRALLGRGAALALVVAAIVQGAVFQWEFRDRGPDRRQAFEAAYPRVFAAAAARPGPIYVLSDDHTYADAYWYAVLRHARRSRLHRLDGPPPAGGTVLGAVRACPGCRLLASGGRFSAFVAR